MAPKRVAAQHKPCSDIVAQLGGETNLTTQALKDLNTLDRKKLFSAYATYRKQSPEAAKEYEDAKNDEERRRLLQKFVLDSSQGKCFGKNTTTVSTSKAEKGVG